MPVDKEQLVEEIRRVTGDALFPRGGWGPAHQGYVNAAREALRAHATAGGFARWDVISAQQIDGILVAIGFSTPARLFVLNPEAIADQILDARWKSADIQVAPGVTIDRKHGDLYKLAVDDNADKQSYRVDVGAEDLERIRSVPPAEAVKTAIEIFHRGSAPSR